MIAQQVKLAAAPWFALNPQFFSPLRFLNQTLPQFLFSVRRLEVSPEWRLGGEDRKAGGQGSGRRGESDGNKKGNGERKRNNEICQTVLSLGVVEGILQLGLAEERRSAQYVKSRSK